MKAETEETVNQEAKREATGFNDVGLLTAPDGKIYSVAVMIGDTPRPIRERQLLMQAVARLSLHERIANVQVSWVKLGKAGIRACLKAGVNDLVGTLMDETISRSAGASHGHEMTPQAMEALIRSLGREPWQRTTLYRPAPAERRDVSFAAAPLAPLELATAAAH